MGLVAIICRNHVMVRVGNSAREQFKRLSAALTVLHDSASPDSLIERMVGSVSELLPGYQAFFNIRDGRGKYQIVANRPIEPILPYMEAFSELVPRANLERCNSCRK